MILSYDFALIINLQTMFSHVLGFFFGLALRENLMNGIRWRNVVVQCFGDGFIMIR